MVTLVERADDLHRLERVLDAAPNGSAGVTLITGPAGLGKTALLEAGLALAHAAGITPLVARAGELERDFAFGIARQLLGPSVAGDDDELLRGAARHAAPALGLDSGASGDVHAILHGLHWLLMDLSSRGPLMVAVDDLQWADEASLRWLAYVARRLDTAPIAVVATVRTAGVQADLPPDASELTRVAAAELVGHAPALRLAPAALSANAVATLVEQALGQAPADAFRKACHELTGGTPFLLAELLAELSADGVAPTSANVGVLESLVPKSVQASVSRRLARLDADAKALAQAAAVLGAETELPVAAQLAGLREDRAARAATALIEAHVLVDSALVRFRHPLLRTAVAADMPAPERAAQHGSAARLLSARGAASGRIATHWLVAGGGRGAPEAVEHLRAAARAAAAQGLPEQAATLLRRALEEPPEAELRATVLSELGAAELAMVDERAADHLAAARQLTTDPAQRIELAQLLVEAEYHRGHHAGGVEIALRAIEEAGEAEDLREGRLRLEAQLALISRYDLATEARTRGRIAALAATLDGVTPAERLVLSTADAQSAIETAAQLVAVTDRSVAGDTVAPWTFHLDLDVAGTTYMYVHAGRPDLGAGLVEARLDSARASGSPIHHSIAQLTRGMVALETGDLRAARADMSEGIAALEELGEDRVRRAGIGVYVRVLAGLGRAGEAEALLTGEGLADELPEQMVFNPFLYSRSILRLAQGRLQDAAADLRELGRRYGIWNLSRPSPPWRATLAAVLAMDGQTEEALSLALQDEPVARRWGTSRAMAAQSRALGLASGDLGALQRAAALLADTEWRLDRAQARFDHGAALRRAGERRLAREQLALAMDEATACGAEPLAEQAADELRASGARPRRRAISGLDALTPSELRVARLAAEGRTNREIAQALFVTSATVETHLTRIYRKLDLSGRGELADALG